MGFEVGPGAYYGLAWSHVGPAVAAGVKKAAFFYCSESPSCDIRKPVNEFASKSGMDIVYTAQVTLTQPDYTAEVLAARNAGAEAIIALLDSASIVRAERSAHRQNWHPIFSTQWSAHEQRLIEAGGADVEGVHVGAAIPNWDSPKLADYRAALRRYVPGAHPSSFGGMQWAAGKLLELLARNFPDQPTSADVLKGLLGLRGETLDGLVAPLTYGGGPGGGNMRTACTVMVKVEGGKFVPLDGDNFTCAPGLEPK
jgi:branched-chain amino acid transport system substrate-binding protein